MSWSVLDQFQRDFAVRNFCTLLMPVNDISVYLPIKTLPNLVKIGQEMTNIQHIRLFWFCTSVVGDKWRKRHVGCPRWSRNVWHIVTSHCLHIRHYCFIFVNQSYQSATNSKIRFFCTVSQQSWCIYIFLQNVNFIRVRSK